VSANVNVSSVQILGVKTLQSFPGLCRLALTLDRQPMARASVVWVIGRPDMVHLWAFLAGKSSWSQTNMFAL
jgi:hypothetical protein